MASETEICNIALSHLGVGQEIANVDTEQSQEAKACRRYLQIAREQTLRDFNWPFSRRYADLGLIEETPNDEWDYSYRYPSDCLRVIKILSGSRNESRQERVPYLIGQDTVGQLIYSDQENAQILYIHKETDPAKYPPDFVMALSYKLAFLIAPRLTGGDPFKLGDRAMQMYMAEISRAAANAFNEEQPDEEIVSEFTRVRD